MSRLGWCAVAIALALGGLPSAGAAQLGARVAALDDGIARFGYPTRSGVEVCEDGIRMGEQGVSWRSSSRDGTRRGCRVGFVEVEVQLRNGVVRDVEIVQGIDGGDARAVDLGEVPAQEAADYLLSLPYGGATPDAAEEAIVPAMLARVDELWRDLLDLAKDRSLDEDVRQSTLFWLGQEAADAATAGLADVALDSDEDQDIRDSAIFALSQRSNDEAVPVLMEVARTAEQAETRRTAMFWLAQSNDDRVVRFFEDILLRRIR